MSPSAYSIAILGAGPVGCALALLLARGAADPSRIVLLHDGAAPALPESGASTAAAPARTTGAVTVAPRADARSVAVNYGSRVLLQNLHAWPARAADIRTIHVSQRGRLGRTLIRHTDFNVPQLGSVAAYSDLHAALWAGVQASGVTLLHAAGARVEVPDGEAATLRTPDGPLRCAVAVRCDGAGGGELRREYGQHAVLATVKATRPLEAWAFERFTREGPLALLPHPAGADTYALVWCCTPERAAALLALDDASFAAALNEVYGERMGPLHCLSARHVFPLFLSARRAVVQGRTVAIGNAAQTLHPVAGQGLNLGLRDAARLAQELAPWLFDPDEAPHARLERYARARRDDRWVTLTLTDLMPRVFATGLAGIEHAAGAALLGLDLIAPLRAPLARQLLQGLRS